MNHDSPLGLARSLLFVPGNRPERFAKALAAGADAVVLDLEDSVPAAAKDAARAAVCAAWPGLQPAARPRVLRINDPRTAAGADDLRALAQLQGLAGLMLPKAESADTLAAVAAALPGVPILPLIESAAGRAACHEVLVELQGLHRAPDLSLHVGKLFLQPLAVHLARARVHLVNALDDAARRHALQLAQFLA